MCEASKEVGAVCVRPVLDGQRLHPLSRRWWSKQEGMGIQRKVEGAGRRRFVKAERRGRAQAIRPTTPLTWGLARNRSDGPDQRKGNEGERVRVCELTIIWYLAPLELVLQVGEIYKCCNH